MLKNLFLLILLFASASVCKAQITVYVSGVTEPCTVQAWNEGTERGNGVATTQLEAFGKTMCVANLETATNGEPFKKGANVKIKVSNGDAMASNEMTVNYPGHAKDVLISIEESGEWEATAVSGVILNEEHFPDAKFRAAIAEKLGIADGDLITDAILNSQAYWDEGFNEKGITSIEGIYYFPNLVSLYLNNGKNATSNLNDLKSVDLSQNRYLLSFYAEYNRNLTSVDVTQNEALQILGLLACDLSTLNVANNPNLIWLYVGDNKNLHSLDVTHNGNLQQLYCFGNGMQSLDISKNPNLFWLNCSGNQIPELDFSSNSAIEHVECAGNRLMALDLANKQKLKFLICSSNGTSATEKMHTLRLENCPALEQVDCEYNAIPSLDVAASTELWELYCSNNQLPSLDLTTNVKLRHLRCDANKIPSLDLSHQPVLETLWCRGNAMSLLNLTGCASLNLIYADNNQFERMDLTDCGGALRTLWLHSNPKLSMIDVSTNVNLNLFYCCGDALEELDVTHNPNLTTLWCHNNQLTELDVTKCPKLTTLYCGGNQLERLDLSKCPNINSFWCHPNHLVELDMTGISTPGGGSLWMTEQTRTMQATYEQVNGGYKYVVTMPDYFTNDDKLYIQEIKTAGVVSAKGDDGLTRFYIEPELRDKTPFFAYSYFTNYTNTSANERKYLEVKITPIYPDPTFGSSGDYRSKFLPDKQLNSYKNTITFTPRFEQGADSYDGKSYSILRLAGTGTVATTVASLTLHKTDGVYQYTVSYPGGSWAGNTEQEDRYDNLPTVNSGAMADGAVIVDYFAASTSDGGDQTGTYTYMVKEDALTPSVSVPVYAAKASAYLVSDYERWIADQSKTGYSQEEVAADIDHSLKVTEGAAVSHSLWGDDSMLSNTLYINDVETETFSVASGSRPRFCAFLSSTGSASHYAFGLNVQNSQGEQNTYGTSRAEACMARAGFSVMNKVVAPYIFKVHADGEEKNCRYYSCTLSVNMVQPDDEQKFTNEGGGYRVWRTCATSAEEYPALSGRSSDFLFYSSTELTEYAPFVENVGDADLAITDHNGKVTHYTSGTFGSYAEEPEASFRVRLYYKTKNALGEYCYYVSDAVGNEIWGHDDVTTAVADISRNGQPLSVRYYDLFGRVGNEPFIGVNIVVARYGNGSTQVTKMIK